MWLNATPPAGAITTLLTAVTFAGTNPPALGNFPGGIPSRIQSADGTKYLNADGDAALGDVVVDRLTLADRDWVAVSAASNQSIPASTETPINFSSVSAGKASMWSASDPSKVLIPSAGLYHIIWRPSLTPGAAAGSRIYLLYRNGNALVRTTQNYYVLSSVPFSWYQELSAGDTVHMRVYQSSGGTMTTSASSGDGPFMQVVRVG